MKPYTWASFDAQVHARDNLVGGTCTASCAALCVGFVGGALSEACCPEKSDCFRVPVSSPFFALCVCVWLRVCAGGAGGSFGVCACVFRFVPLFALCAVS